MHRELVDPANRVVIRRTVFARPFPVHGCLPGPRANASCDLAGWRLRVTTWRFAGRLLFVLRVRRSFLRWHSGYAYFGDAFGFRPRLWAFKAL